MAQAAPSPMPSPSPSSSPVLPFTNAAYPSTSPPPTASASPASPNGVGVADRHRLVHQGVELMNANKFHECTAMFAANAHKDHKIALLHCYMSFIKAVSSHGETDMKEALALVWETDKRAEAQAKLIPVESKLIQADAHFLGALVQLIDQRYVKFAWNMRKSLNFYQAAQKDLNTYGGADRLELLGWCDYGLGLFNLVLSFLPPSVMKVASWSGYGGDRELGLALLHRSQASTSFMAPFSCLLLLTFYSSIASFTGEPEDTYLALSEPLFDWAKERYPDGVLFLLMKSRSWRCRRDLQQAIQVAKQAIQNCAELPSVAVLFHFNTGWCSFFLLDWQASAYYFDQLLHLTPSGAYQPPAGSSLVKHSEAELALIAEEQAGLNLRMPPAKASALAFYACMVGINYMLLGNRDKARWYLSLVAGLHDKKSDKPIDLFAKRKSAEMLARTTGDRPEDALLDACELILTWNGAAQMPRETCQKMLTMLDAAEALRLPHWQAEQRAAVCLYRADMLKGLGDVPSALGQMQGFMAQLPVLLKSSRAKADGTVAFGYYISAFLLLQVGNVVLSADHLKKAQAITGYDQYQQMQVRMHALGQMLQRKKKEMGIK